MQHVRCDWNSTTCEVKELLLSQHDQVHFSPMRSERRLSIHWLFWSSSMHQQKTRWALGWNALGQNKTKQSKTIHIACPSFIYVRVMHGKWPCVGMIMAMIIIMMSMLMIHVNAHCFGLFFFLFRRFCFYYETKWKMFNTAHGTDTRWNLCARIINCNNKEWRSLVSIGCYRSRMLHIPMLSITRK